MKMKRLIAVLCASMSIGLMPLASCSFFNTDQALQIKSVTHDSDENGNVIVTITYTDEEATPTKFTIPAGISGKEGVGIASVDAVENEDKSTTLTIHYTDSSIDDTIVTIPGPKDGKGISDVVINQVEGSNDLNVTITYTDNSSDKFTIPGGKDGIDGVGIADIETNIDDSGDTVVTIKLTNDTSKVVTIKKGEQGDSISSIDMVTVDNADNEELEMINNSHKNDWIFKVNYESGAWSYFFIQKTKDGKDGSTWRYGSDIPAGSFGNDGDFYLNISTGGVYTKENGAWSEIFSIKGSSSNESQKYFVYFNALTDSSETLYFKDSDGTEKALGTNIYPIKVNGGSYVDLDEFPVIKKNGHTFKGWYTSRDDVNSGQFTDLTIVNHTISLFARWSD
ncbi:lPXTG-domain-containing protein cell wall anchor protein [Clostridium sp. CAG:568]|nr:lPXTG-domain-containing protein cell wall anchor protein [Clostridium sp. CAG:568]